MEGKIDLSSSGTGPSIDHGAYSTLTEFILLKRNVKLLMLHFFGLEVPECCLWISNKGKPPLSLCHLINESSVQLATPRGQGRGRTVIPGFAVRYISIMLPSQTRHLMCQSQTVVLPSPLPLFLHMRWRVTREEGTTSFSLALLHFPFLIESRKPLHYWYRGQKVASSICSGKEHLEASFCLVSYHA